MADQGVLKRNLRYLRLIIYAVVLIAIWFRYDRNKDQWNHRNGQPKIIGQKVNGKDEGTWTWFFENGKKQMQGNFSNGKRDGLWTLWDSTGNKISESTYVNDRLNGEFTRWYPDGNIQTKGLYRNDTLMESVHFQPVKNRE